MTSRAIRTKQATKLHDNWVKDGHWGMYEDDEENNEDTRCLIRQYAQEHDGKVILLHSKPDGSLHQKRYDPEEYIFNFRYKYITADPDVANALCEAHNGSYEEMLEKLTRLHGKEYIYLIWN